MDFYSVWLLSLYRTQIPLLQIKVCSSFIFFVKSVFLFCLAYWFLCEFSQSVFLAFRCMPRKATTAAFTAAGSLETTPSMTGTWPLTPRRRSSSAVCAAPSSHGPATCTNICGPFAGLPPSPFWTETLLKNTAHNVGFEMLRHSKDRKYGVSWNTCRVFSFFFHCPHLAW